MEITKLVLALKLNTSIITWVISLSDK